MFTKHFDDYACEGDTIECEKDGFTVIARIVRDDCSDAPDQRDDGFWPSLDRKDAGFIGDGVTIAEFAEQETRAQEIMDAWKNDEWFYCGIVLSVSKNGIVLDNHAASLWGIECNYPKNPKETRPDMPGSFPNYYLTEVANELLSEAIAIGQKSVETIHGENYFIEFNGDNWQSVFPSQQSEKSQLHTSIDDAFSYMVNECKIKDHITVINPNNSK